MTRIVEREDVRVMATVTSRLGDKGFLGNQEIGGGCRSASSKRSVIAIASDATNAEMCVDVSPSLLSRMYKGGVWIVYETD